MTLMDTSCSEQKNWDESYLYMVQPAKCILSLFEAKEALISPNYGFRSSYLGIGFLYELLKILVSKSLIFLSYTRSPQSILSVSTESHSHSISDVSFVQWLSSICTCS
jgi:hypothetical protein